MGATPRIHLRAGSPQDHPRLLGSDNISPCASSSLIGSPTRTWEQPLRSQSLQFHLRITHAHVGATSCQRVIPPLPMDHPRIRGNNTSSIFGVKKTSGSPTRAWEQRLATGPPCVSARVTHVYVGAADSSVHPSSRSTDHPRVRGNNAFDPIIQALEAGSPTRTWEQPGYRFTGAFLVRTTHASMGTKPFSKPMI